MRKLPPLNALKSFEVAARHLSFTKAAEELFVTQAAVSHQVKALEDFLQLKLFIRRNRSLLLTEEGQAYYLELRDIFEQLAQSTDKLRRVSERGALTVSVPPSFAILWFVPRLSSFREQHPEMDIRIKAVDEITGSLTDDVDVAIYYGDGRWPHVKSYRLHQEYLWPVCSPFLIDKAGIQQPADLLKQNLLHDETRNAWNDWFKMVGISGYKGDNGPVFSHSSLALQAAVHGQGVALANNVLAKPEIDSGHLVRVFPQALRRNKAFYMVCRDNQAEIGKIATFRQWLLNIVEQEEQEFSE